jgi:hypothetical protein
MICPAKLIILSLAAGVVFGFGCDRDDQITSYEAPKERAVATPPQFAMADAAEAAAPAEQQEAAPVIWAVPAGWKQLAGSEMRFATFRVSEASPNIQLTVIPLGPESGQLLPNLNRWEQQLDLPPSSEADAPKRVTEVKLADSTAYTIDLANKQQRMLAAIIPHENRVWFFKLVGPATVVSPQKEAFDAFIKSIKFAGGGAPGPLADAQPGAKPGELPSGHPALPQQDGSQPKLPSGHPALPAPDAGHAQPEPSNDLSLAPTWKRPVDWTEEPPKPMRAASYFIDAQGQKAEVIVTKMDANHFGTLLSNINRWRGQVGLQALADESAVKPQIIKVGGKELSLFDFVGPKGDDGSARRILVTMSVNGPDVWFFKLQGPDDLVSKEKPAFESFLGAVQFQPAAGQ